MRGGKLREIFGRQLAKFKDQPIIRKNKEDNNKTVIFMDDRRDYWFMAVLKNFSYYLDDSWNFTVICTDRNIGWVLEELGRNKWKINVRHINEFISDANSSTLDLPTYIKFYTSTDVLEKFNEEIFLTAQFDSMLCRPLEDKWLSYDFIGAPCGIDGKVMNGGCTIRNKNRMIECLEKFLPDKNVIDDVYYSEKFRELGFNVPTVEEAANFAVENFFGKEFPFGFHGTEKYYFDDNNANILINNIHPIYVKKPLIFLCSPVYKMPAHPKFMESVERVKNDPRFDVELRFVVGDAHIERARSMLLMQYLKKERPYDWLVMIDSDIEFNGDILWGIINREKRVIGAAYAFKAEEGHPKYRQPVIRQLKNEVPDSEGLLRVAYLGGGFTILRDDFVGEMTEYYKDLKFYMNPDLNNNKNDGLTYALWTPLLVPQEEWGKDEDGNNKLEMLSEDYAFCHRILDMNEPLYVDMSAVVAHWKDDKAYQLELREVKNNGTN